MHAMKEVSITVKVNGVHISASVSPEESLLDLLRYKAGSTDVKCGCNKGDCGSCTVILGEHAVKSCIVLAAQANGKEVLTLKGMEGDRLFQELQKSFAIHGAVQCGFCTPGMLISARKLLEYNQHPDREEIKNAISGNLCRCTGYKKIVDAIEAVASMHLPMGQRGF